MLIKVEFEKRLTLKYGWKLLQNYERRMFNMIMMYS